ncbi:MAG TPA: O-antigen ligase family protein [Brumimicrobium sp.]|nr:O-antigen ligase family protein [Brumimicrobium sp.]
MLDRLFGFKIHDYLQALGLFILAVGVPLNKVLMSIGTIWLAANLLLKADFKTYWNTWKQNLVFWFVGLTLALHLFGLFYSDDLSYAFRDLNTKLPLFVIPVALIAYPIQKHFFNLILYGFLAALMITSIVNISYMMSNELEDYREFSLFGSHIRYSLLIVTGVLISIYFWMKNSKLWFVFMAFIAWFLYYTLISQVLSGYIALFFLFIGLLIFLVRKFQNLWLKNTTIIVVLSLLAVSGMQMYRYLQPNREVLVFENLPERSEAGGLYYHDTTLLWFENGNHIMSFISGEELKSSWEKRSEIRFGTQLQNGFKVDDILVRYMASKGITKDSVGMLQMTSSDIENVENGLSSIVYTYGTIKQKSAELKSEVLHYSLGGDPDGNSLLQRIEHWKAGASIISKNWIFGVGTGDVQAVFNEEYKNSNTQLDENNWNRTHNQFMTFWIAFGILGFILFTGFWFLFLWKNIRLNNLIGIGFTLIAIASFLSEDTIETQQGVTYIALFLGLCSMMNMQANNDKIGED